MQDDDEAPSWNEEIAEDLVGATIIIGLTILRKSGEPEHQVQMHGVISKAGPDVGVTVDLAGAREGESYTLPPDLSAIQPAPPGAYRFRSTGEVIENPDYMTTWTITRPD